jgi:hypothetical protein
MTIGRARFGLSLFCIAAMCPLFLLFIFQSILGKYGDDWDTPWNWFIPAAFPILTLIVGVLISSDAKKFHSKEKVESASLCLGVMLLSIIYVVSLYAIVFMQPFANLPIQTLFRNSGWYLGALQGVIVLALHKFLSEIHKILLYKCISI